jgi:hypothetical protein
MSLVSGLAFSAAAIHPECFFLLTECCAQRSSMEEPPSGDASVSLGVDRAADRRRIGQKNAYLDARHPL